MKFSYYFIFYSNYLKHINPKKTHLAILMTNVLFRGLSLINNANIINF